MSIFYHVLNHPDVGDDTRLWGPPWMDENISAYFPAINRNKKVQYASMYLKKRRFHDAEAFPEI